MNASTPEQESLMPTDTVPTDTRMRAGLAAAPRLMLADSRQHSLCEVLDRVLNKGAVIDGEATLLTGPDLVNSKKRPDDERTVVLQNGPGYNSDSITQPMVTHLKAGDMIVIPAGTGHWFTEIPDHITYMMVRVDPDKVVPTKSQAQSEADLKVIPPPGKGR